MAEVGGKTGVGSETMTTHLESGPLFELATNQSFPRGERLFGSGIIITCKHNLQKKYSVY